MTYPTDNARPDDFGEPKHGDLAWFENCVPGGDPYRVTVVYRHKRGWFNAAGTDNPLDPEYLADKPLHLFWRDHRPAENLGSAHLPHPQGGTETLRAQHRAAMLRDPDIHALHEFAKQYVLAVKALEKVRGPGLSTTLAYLIEHGYLVPADPRRA